MVKRTLLSTLGTNGLTFTSCKNPLPPTICLSPQFPRFSPPSRTSSSFFNHRRPVTCPPYLPEQSDPKKSSPYLPDKSDPPKKFALFAGTVGPPKKFTLFAGTVGPQKKFTLFAGQVGPPKKVHPICRTIGPQKTSISCANFVQDQSWWQDENWCVIWGCDIIMKIKSCKKALVKYYLKLLS